MRDPYLFDDCDVMRNLLGIKDAGEFKRAEADITYFTLADVDGAVVSLPFNLARLYAIHKHIFGDIFDWAGMPRTVQIAKSERVLGNDTVRYSYPDNIEKDAIPLLAINAHQFDAISQARSVYARSLCVGMQYNAVIKELNIVDWADFNIHETAVIFAKLIAELWQVHPFREGNTRTTITFAVQFAEAHGFRMDKTLLKESAAYVRDALVKASDGQYSEYDYLTIIFEDAIVRG